MTRQEIAERKLKREAHVTKLKTEGLTWNVIKQRAGLSKSGVRKLYAEAKAREQAAAQREG